MYFYQTSKIASGTCLVSPPFLNIYPSIEPLSSYTPFASSQTCQKSDISLSDLTYDRLPRIGQPIARLETSYASTGTVGTVAFIKARDMQTTICF